MTSESIGPRPDTARMEEATQWLLRLRNDSATEQDVSDWLGWYESDDRNRQAFDEMRGFWLDAGRLADGARGVARIDHLTRYESSPETRSLWRPNGLTRRAWESWRSVARQPTRIALAASVAAIVSVLLLMFRPATPTVSNRNETVAARSIVRHTQLPDGSSVDLAASSAVAVEYTAAQRTLELTSGEAYFVVAPNHSRPFIVNAGGVRVLAVGTKFNVREAGDRVVVTVTEGVVEVSLANTKSAEASPSATAEAGAGKLRLGAGNEVTWIPATGERVVRATDVEHALAWRNGRLEYINEPLSAVIADVNRYSSKPIAIRDPQVGRMTYTGTVLIDSIDEWLRAMPGEFPITIEVADRSLIIVPANTAAAASDSPAS